MPVVKPFLPLKQARFGEKEGEFFWDFEEHSIRTVMLGKGVRIISGLRSAMLLADNGYVTECMTILRVVDECISEIGFLVEGCGAKEPLKEHVEFVRQYFLPMPMTSEEHAKMPKQKWVKREDIQSGFLRLSDSVLKEVDLDTDKVKRSMKFVTYTFDKYVHAGYLTTVELYSGKTKRFMLGGHEGSEERTYAKQMVASKLHNSMGAFAHVSRLFGDEKAMWNFKMGGMALYESGEIPVLESSPS